MGKGAREESVEVSRGWEGVGLILWNLKGEGLDRLLKDLLALFVLFGGRQDIDDVFVFPCVDQNFDQGGFGRVLARSKCSDNTPRIAALDLERVFCLRFKARHLHLDRTACTFNEILKRRIIGEAHNLHRIALAAVDHIVFDRPCLGNADRVPKALIADLARLTRKQRQPEATQQKHTASSRDSLSHPSKAPLWVVRHRPRHDSKITSGGGSSGSIVLPYVEHSRVRVFLRELLL